MSLAREIIPVQQTIIKYMEVHALDRCNHMYAISP